MSNFILISTVFTISPGTGICDLKEGLQEDWFCLLLPMMVLKIPDLYDFYLSLLVMSVYFRRIRGNVDIRVTMGKLLLSLCFSFLFCKMIT